MPAKRHFDKVTHILAFSNPVGHSHDGMLQHGDVEIMEEQPMPNQGTRVFWIGWTAFGISVFLWLSFGDQIRLNVSGQKGSLIVPIMVVANCVAWVLYGLLKSPRDWPVAISNIIGVVLGLAAAVTWFM
ncbi:MAG: SemiSWEET family transporter [Patescibacteria group bacterium]